MELNVFKLAVGVEHADFFTEVAAAPGFTREQVKTWAPGMSDIDGCIRLHSSRVVAFNGPAQEPYCSDPCVARCAGDG